MTVLRGPWDQCRKFREQFWKLKKVSGEIGKSFGIFKNVQEVRETFQDSRKVLRGFRNSFRNVRKCSRNLTKVSGI